ncbi:MAG: MFS transporter [Lentisphaeria bacterium]|nr:MFS transporter [Lentisphaeria bacterium]
MSFADSLGEAGRKRGRLYAYGACLCGCISEVMLDISAIIILYIQMLGGNDMVMMSINSFTGLVNMFLFIPCVAVIARIGLKPSVRIACFTGTAGYLLMAFAPFFGAYKCHAAVAGCFIYCLQRALYGACWYPLLDAFLRPEDRGKFFGTLRFLYYSFTGILFYLIGIAMGKNPPEWLMQVVIGLTGLCLLGRNFCISRFPEDRETKRETPEIRKALRISICNGPLTAYSVYGCLLMVASTSLGPVTYIYLREYVKMDPGTVQKISAIGMAGHICGFLLYNKLLKFFGMKKLEIAVHLSYMITALLMFILDNRLPGYGVMVSIILCVICFTGSVFGCNNSGEMLALARPGNKTMATAFVQTYFSFGGFIGRGSVTLLLGATLLEPVWQFCGMEVSRYQSIFLFSGVIAAVVMLLIPTLPSVVPKHHDYYEPYR